MGCDRFLNKRNKDEFIYEKNVYLENQLNSVKTSLMIPQLEGENLE
jgi:hypothetical protein